MTIASARQTTPTTTQAPSLGIAPSDLLERDADLVSLPDIYIRVRGVMDDPESSMADLSRVVSSDPSLAARLLKLANSAFFGFTSRIDTIDRATNLLGTQQIHDLVLATTVADAFSDMSPNGMSMQEFWTSSVHCALLAKLLGSACGIVDAERFFVQGLLHGIGHLLLDQGAPDAVSAAWECASAEDRPLWRVEREQIGCDYAEVGAGLMAQWQLPPNLVEALRYQNEPEEAEQHPLDVAVMHAATVMLLAERTDADDAQTLLVVEGVAVDVLGLDEATIAAVRGDAAGALGATFELLFPQID